MDHDKLKKYCEGELAKLHEALNHGTSILDNLVVHTSHPLLRDTILEQIGVSIAQTARMEWVLELLDLHPPTQTNAITEVFEAASMLTRLPIKP